MQNAPAPVEPPALRLPMKQAPSEIMHCARPPEAGQVLAVGRNASYEAARTGQLPTLKIGKRVVVPIVAFKRLLTETR
jgi:hypothetical protein